MTENSPSSSVTKKCPFCAEEIKSVAIKCRFCGEFLSEKQPHKKSQQKLQPTSAKLMREEIKKMAQEGRNRKKDPKAQAELAREIRASKNAKLQEKSQKPVTCPRCGSEQVTAQRKGFGWGKALIGGVLTGGVGLIAGFHGSRKVLVTCLKCGNQFYPPKHK